AATPPVMRPAATPSPAASSAAGMSEQELRALYENFLAAKRSCKEDTSRFTFETLARTVNKQAPEIAAKFNAKRVEFKVAVRGGKAVLTAVPKP
ncbi:MAG TPA: MXAN_5187 C-terminal domain-containing protein, partial [Anaeromyxobacteraceae bacterium]|nr:MXAN_5187 C-terminal domain-containing protein [Anaeromyxobacteraceae bacterium]